LNRFKLTVSEILKNNGQIYLNFASIYFFEIFPLKDAEIATRVNLEIKVKKQ